MNRKRILFFYIIIIFQLSGCAPLLIVGGVATVKKVSNSRHKKVDLDTKEAYGKYRYEIQQKDIEPMTFEEWLEAGN